MYPKLQLVIKVLLIFIFIMSLMAVIVDYPLALGALMVPLVTGVSFSLSAFKSVFFGFVLFMVVVGGLLVVFAYAVALSPEVSFSVKPYKYPVMMIIFLSMMWWKSLSKSLMEFPSMSSQSGFQLYGVVNFSFSWGLCSVYLCGLLFLVMVAVAGSCGKLSRSGAMVVGKW